MFPVSHIPTDLSVDYILYFGPHILIMVHTHLFSEHNGAMSESGGDFTVPEFLMDGKYALFENV